MGLEWCQKEEESQNFSVEFVRSKDSADNKSANAKLLEEKDKWTAQWNPAGFSGALSDWTGSRQGGGLWSLLIGLPKPD